MLQGREPEHEHCHDDESDDEGWQDARGPCLADHLIDEGGREYGRHDPGDSQEDAGCDDEGERTVGPAQHSPKSPREANGGPGPLLQVRRLVED